MIAKVVSIMIISVRIDPGILSLSLLLVLLLIPLEDKASKVYATSNHEYNQCFLTS